MKKESLSSSAAWAEFHGACGKLKRACWMCLVAVFHLDDLSELLRYCRDMISGKYSRPVEPFPRPYPPDYINKVVPPEPWPDPPEVRPSRYRLGYLDMTGVHRHGLWSNAIRHQGCWIEIEIITDGTVLAGHLRGDKDA